MTPREILKMLHIAVDNNISTFIWGSPGIGKSAIVNQLAVELNRELIDIRVSMLDPVELRGLPYIKNGRASWSIPDFLPDKENTILFLDEINTAPPSMQPVLYQLIWEGKLGEYELPKGSTVIAAGNLDTDRAVTTKMSTALGSRFWNLNFEPDLEDWLHWAVNNTLSYDILSYLRFRPANMYKFDPTTMKGEKTFPCPRTWEQTNKILKSVLILPVKYQLDAFSGFLGKAVATDFIGFLQIKDKLPNIKNILENPKTEEIPTEPSIIYATLGALLEISDLNNFDKITTYISRLPNEFQTVFMRDINIKSKVKFINLTELACYTKWAIKNSHFQI